MTSEGPIEEWATANYQDDPDGMKSRIKNLREFCDWTGFTAEQFLEKAEESKPGRPPTFIKERIVAYLQHLRQEGFAESTLALKFSHIRTFFLWNNLFLPRLLWKKESNYPDYEDTTRVQLTQAKVRRMVATAPTLKHRAVLAFLGQTGQRMGILTALKWSHIEEYREGTVGVVTVTNPYVDRRGVNVNKIRSRFRFVIGPQAFAMMKQLTKQKDGWVFSYRPRQINRIVIEAANRIGIQKITERRKQFNGKKGVWHAVHAHTLRGYWAGQMRKAEVHQDIVEYMMGHKPPHQGTYKRFTNRELLQNYRKAEPYLAIKGLEAK